MGNVCFSRREPAMVTTEDQRTGAKDLAEAAGFWARFITGLLDLMLIAVIVVVIAGTAASFGVYVPVELSVITVYAVYTGVSLAWKGQTLAGWLCGLRVTGRSGKRPGLGRSLVRALVVTAFQCLLGLPFLVVAGRRSKGGWHDSIAGTQVLNVRHCRTRRRCVFASVGVALAVWIGVQAVGAWELHRAHTAWRADADARAEKMQSPADPAIDVSSLDDAERRDMAAWLDNHAQDPTDCIVGLAAQHQVTLIGEIHGQKQYLAFFNRIIPDLYHRAGVRVIALECCHPDQDGELQTLVNGEQFDHELLYRIARRAVWQAWTWKGYWDVLETVWTLNRSLPQYQEPLRVVGISPRFDGPSFALVKNGPWREKLRILRVIDDLPWLALHDAHYATHVEQQAFTGGRRTVVWVGGAHALLRCSSEIQKNGRVVTRTHRMGSMLYGRYGDQVAQVMLHDGFQHGAIAQLVEECAGDRSLTGVAFTVADSPFASLRDGHAFHYQRQSERRFADVVRVYVILAPMGALQPCDSLEGFVSQPMFGRNRPFYEMLCRRDLADHNEASRHLSKGINRL